MMDRLGSDLLINCLKYLNYDELYRCNAINSFFSQCVHHDSLWKYWLSTLYGITRLEYPPGTGETQQETNSLSYMNCFKSWMVSFQGYSFHDIRKTKKWWERYELWCQEYAPEILTTLCPPATESELNSVENFLNQKLPSSLRLFYRFHNGQNIPFDRDPRTVESRGWGLFGGTHYYDSFANLRFLSLNRLQEVTLQCQNLISQGVHPRCLPHAKYSGTNPRGRTNQGVNFSLVDNNYYYDDDDISSPLSNHLPLSDPIPDNFSEIFAFATNGRRISKMYCIGKDHVGNLRGGIVYVNTSMNCFYFTISYVPLL